MDRYKDCTSAQTNLVRAEVTIPLASGIVLQPSVAGIKPKNTPAVPIGVWKGILEGPAEAGP
jgi:hypothetical protein